ncbi:hypothetical protein CW696_07695 [ANME-2 cluster archaeon]|nr:MAG: hypothetical protein CW696_07695 [ANME-2 cluster archaeon]
MSITVASMRAEIEQKIDDMSVSYPEDITFWDYDAVRDYVNALESVEDLVDTDAEIHNSRVLTPEQIDEISDIVTKRIVELEARNG